MVISRREPIKENAKMGISKKLGNLKKDVKTT